MNRSASQTPIATPLRRRIFPDPALLPLPVYRDFVDMLYSMRLPVLGLGAGDARGGEQCGHGAAQSCAAEIPQAKF